MKLRAAASVLCVVGLCVACAACAPAGTIPGAATHAPALATSAPSEATQTIRGVTVAVETTTTQASETSYGVSNVLITPKAGYRLASVIGIATNSTDATVSVPDVPARVRDTDGAELQRWGAMRLIISASGGMVPSRLVGHHDVAPQGMEPGGKTYYIVSYQRPSASRGPVTVVWTLGGGRTYTFTLQSP